MLKKKMTFLLATAVLSAAMLNGCGNANKSDSGDKQMQAQASPAASITPKSADSTNQTASKTADASKTVASSTSAETAATTSAASSTAASKAASTTSTGKIDDIHIFAKDFEYDQKEIHVKKGDKVKITLKSDDGGHGFTIPDYKVNIQGNGSAEFVADKAGTFEYHCSVMCGSGHAKMTGKLIVE